MSDLHAKTSAFHEARATVSEFEDPQTSNTHISTAHP